MAQNPYEYFRWRELGLPREVWAPFAAGRQPQRVEPGRMIYLQGSPATHFYYIRQGSVKTFLSSRDGGEQILKIYHTGDIFGEASFFDEQPRVSSATALTPCQVIAVDREQAERVFRERPELAMAMMKYLAGTVRMLSSHVDDMAFLRADQRVARLLLSLGEGKPGPVRCTHEFLSHTVGVSRVTVSRILGKFEDQGLIRLGYGQVELLDPERLDQAAR